MVEIEQLTEENKQLKAENHQLRLKVQALEMTQIKAILQDDERQQQLHIEYTQAIEEVEEKSQDNESDEGKPPPKPRAKRKKKRLSPDKKFAHIPVKKTTVLIPKEVKNNPELWEKVGETKHFELVVNPATVHRHEIIQEKYRCKADRDAPLIKATAPVRFSSSYVSISLAVYIAITKYLEHNPLYRQEQIFRRMGVDIPRQTQSDIVEQMAQWFRPLYEYIELTTKQSKYLLIDETFIKYINGKNKGVGQGYFWAYYAPDGNMGLKWILDRKHKNVDELIDGFEGLLQSDGYDAYNNYAKAHDDIILLACWAHTFGKFRDAFGDEPVHSKGMLHEIGALYKLEQKWDEENVTPQQRKQLRLECSMPIVETIKTKLDAYSVDFSIPNNGFRTAVNYALGQWPALLRCFDYGYTKLDTNLLEVQFRPKKVGLKNYLFIGHPLAGEKSAIIYTLLSCCTLHRIHPWDYLNDALQKLIKAPQSGPTEKLLQELLPQNWAKANPDKIIKELHQA